MSDTLDTLICPACGKEMEKVFLPIQGFYVDVCTKGCGGIFLDNREFKQVDEQHEDISPIFEAISGKTFIKVSQTKTRVCPVCGHNMVKNYSSHKLKVQVDDCYNCGGKFLDHNELTEIRNEFVTEEVRVDEFMKYLGNIMKGMDDI